MEIEINGQKVLLDSAASGRNLLSVLRNDLHLTGTRYGCGIGLCGACTVHVNGEAKPSCTISLGSLAGKKIPPTDGLARAGGGGGLHPLQQAFIDFQVPQCGFCFSGQIMSAAAFLKKRPRPGEAEIRKSLSGNLCRCGTYPRIVKAVLLAAGRKQ